MRLLYSSILFGVLWAAGMLWWQEEPIDAASIVIWSIAGAVAATLWYWLMRLWMQLLARWSAKEP